MWRSEVKKILIYSPFIVIFSVLTLAADKTGKLGILGTLITLFVDPENFELRYKIKIKERLKLRILTLKDIFLSMYCSWYITYIFNHLVKKQQIIQFTNWILPLVFFLLIWLAIRIQIPKTIKSLNKKTDDDLP